MKIAEVKQLFEEREKLVARINHLKGQPAKPGDDPVPPQVMLAVPGAGAGRGDAKLSQRRSYGESEVQFTVYQLPAELGTQARNLLLERWHSELDAIDLKLSRIEGVKP